MTGMSPQLEGSHAPSQIEFLYERYRPVLKWLLILAIIGAAIYYGLRWRQQAATNANWSRFATSIGSAETYTDFERAMDSLTDAVAERSLETLESEFRVADAAQRPYVLLAIARKALQEKNFDRSESALAQLERDYPKHALLQANEYPVQVREVVKKDEPKDTPPDRSKKPELKPAKAGSAVSMLREQIAAAKEYKEPAQFARVEPPTDAPKVRFELSGEHGSFTIALMKEHAKHHCEKFLELAAKDEGFWKGLNVDEIQRTGKNRGARRPMQLHLGFATTKDTDRTKWSKADPCLHALDFEKNTLSHFAGAVSAREAADGKSCAERFWIAVDDAAEHDGSRVVFGYVVEGLDNLRRICEDAAMSTQDAESGVGIPADNITVVSVKVL